MLRGEAERAGVQLLRHCVFIFCLQLLHHPSLGKPNNCMLDYCSQSKRHLSSVSSLWSTDKTEIYDPSPYTFCSMAQCDLACSQLMLSSLRSWKLCIISYTWGPALSKLLKFTQLVNERSELNSDFSLFFTWMTHTPWCALECPHCNNSSLLLINFPQCFNQQNFISHSFGD